jgi:hypothetical protein
MTGQKRQEIEIGGKRHHLLFSYNMLCMVEEQGGTKELLSADIGAKNFTGARAILWAAINAAKAESVTVDEAGDLCEKYAEEHGGIDALAKKINDMLSAANLVGATGKNPDPAPETPAAAKRAPSKN